MTDYVVRCGEEDHVVRIEGRRVSCPHHNVRAEMALVTMGGEICTCLAVALTLEFDTCPSVDGAEVAYLTRLWDLNRDVVDQIVATGAGQSESILHERGQVGVNWDEREQLVLDWEGE